MELDYIPPPCPFDILQDRLMDAGVDYPVPSGDIDLQAYLDAGVIPKDDLESGAWYWGLCRNTTIAMWNADNQVFWHVRVKFNKYFAESIRHLCDADPFHDAFLPLEKAMPASPARKRSGS